MSKLEEIRAEIENFVETTKKVVHGANDLVLSTCLVIVSAYNAYDLTIREVDSVEFYIRAFASGLIGITGASAVVKVFKAIGDKESK